MESRGVSARGGTCPKISGRGRRCGNGITAGPWMAPTMRCSQRSPPLSGSRSGWWRISRGCFRWIRRACGRIDIARALVPTRLPRGALSIYQNAADEPADHAIGRSRGGLTTKIHALTDQRQAPVTIRLTAGQAGDNPQLVPLLDAHAAACGGNRTSGGDVRLLADKAYSHPSTRAELRCRRVKHTIPERSDQIARRKAKGSAGGRPPAFDPGRYRLRNTVERGFNRLKTLAPSPPTTTNTP